MQVQGNEVSRLHCADTVHRERVSLASSIKRVTYRSNSQRTTAQQLAARILATRGISGGRVAGNPENIVIEKLLGCDAQACALPSMHPR